MRRIAARQGVPRLLGRTLDLPGQRRFSRLPAPAASFVLAKPIFAHMILAVARRPAGAG
ncbi:MAG: hypothetical protein ACE5LF_01195 [Alphaproteobacteria bacterium]